MQDIGPKYAGVLLGLSNTAGVLAGVISTAATGYILASGTWNDVWSSAIFFYIIGTIIWNLFATGLIFHCTPVHCTPRNGKMRFVSEMAVHTIYPCYLGEREGREGTRQGLNSNVGCR